MSNTRPSLQRKQTRKTEENRDDALDAGVSIVVNGETYTVRMGDLSGWDEMCLRREVGLSFNGLLEALAEDAGVDLIAAIVWLARRTDGEQMLKYKDVATEIGFDVEVEAVNPGEEEDPEDDSPEASDGSS